MANTYKLISSVTVGSGGAANVEFTSIPATYTDLLIKGSFRHNSSVVYAYCKLRFNGITATNYSDRILYGDNGTAGSVSNSSVTSISGGMSVGATAIASTFSNVEWYIPNYTSSNQKSVSIDAVAENNSATSANGYLTAGIFTGTSAITSITLFPDSGSFVQYSTAYLYGISNA